MRALKNHKTLAFRLQRLLFAAFLTFIAFPAGAQFTRDSAANKKIDEAINTHYVATDFEKAEGVLLGTINACADKCSPGVFGRAWMYVGIVRGSGRNNQAGAKEAFQKAFAADPNVKLDMVLSTPETQATFQDVAGGGSAPAPTPSPTPAAPAAPAGPAEGGLVCTPDVREVETRRPIPVQCRSDEEVTSMELRYKAFGSETWKTVAMTKKGDSFRGEVPCTVTQNSGALRLYVRAKDAQGEEVDTWGKKTAPVEFQLAETVAADPPSYDDADAPERCAAKEECPPDFPGCGTAKAGAGRGSKDWGVSCNNSTECKEGLLCEEGTCQTAPSCETSADCDTGSCVEGRCDIPAGELGPSVPYKKNWLGIQVAQDIAIVGGSNVCDPTLGQAEDNYACFYEGTSDQPFFHTPFPYKDGITTGTAIATTRILLTYDRAFTPNITIGARVGYAFRGGPPAGQTPADPPEDTNNPNDIDANALGTGGTAFLPIHAEAHASFWFLPLSAKLLRAHVTAGGGMAQVDAKVSVPERDCAESRVTTGADAWNPAEDGTFEECRLGNSRFKWPLLAETPVDAWKKMGQGFIKLGVGGMLAFKDNMGVTLGVDFMYMLPASGIVIEPSLGFTLGL